MARARAYYERLTWWFTRQEIGQSLRERYEVPPKLLALVGKLEAVERNQPRLRSLISKLDAIEGNCLLRYAQPVEPRSVGPSDTIGP